MEVVNGSLKFKNFLCFVGGGGGGVCCWLFLFVCFWLFDVFLFNSPWSSLRLDGPNEVQDVPREQSGEYQREYHPYPMIYIWMLKNLRLGNIPLVTGSKMTAVKKQTCQVEVTIFTHWTKGHPFSLWQVASNKNSAHLVFYPKATLPQYCQ